MRDNFVNLQPPQPSSQSSWPVPSSSPVKVTYGTVQQPQGSVREVLLVDPPPTSLFTGRSDNILQWANFYPTLQTIAVGEQHAKYPTHGHVHDGFLAKMAKASYFVAQIPNQDSIVAYPLGRDAIIPINNHQALLKKVNAPEACLDEVDKLRHIVEAYCEAVIQSKAIVQPTGGRIIALIDSPPHRNIFSLIEASLPEGEFRSLLCCHEKKTLLPIVNGYVDGKNYIIRIEPLPEDCSPAEIRNLAKLYEQTIDIATIRAHTCGGAVSLQADGDSQKLVAKLLNRLHQVVDPNQSVAEMIRKATKQSASGRYIYNANTGTRYYFPEDLLSIAKQSVITLAPHLSERERETLVTDHHQQFTTTLGELVQFLNSRNRMGNREGQIFLVDKAALTVNNNTDTLARFADQLDAVLTTVEKSTNWLNDQFRVYSELQDIVHELKSQTHPDFFGINLKSPRFVELVNRALRSESSKIDLGEDFSTPLSAREFGAFQADRRGNRQFVVTSRDPQLRAIAEWLFNSEGGLKILSRDEGPSQIAKADYVSLYVPETPLTFEPHPTNFVRRFGHLEAKSFVVEFGQLGQAPERWVIEENVWAPARWDERRTPTVGKLMSQLDRLNLSLFVKDFKDAQYELFGALLSAMRDSSVALAPTYQWVSIPGLGPSDISIDNCRVRPFINGTRSDKVKFDEWSSVRLAPTIEMLGDLMAAGIIAQLPHLPRRDIILSNAPGKRTIGGVTFLSPGESFCHSSRAKNIKEYLQDVVPRLYGNHIARWIASIGHVEGSSEDKSWRKVQRVLIDSCVSRISQRLSEISKGSTPNGERIREQLAQKMDRVAQRYGNEIAVWRPAELQIATFLPFSRRLLDLNRSQIRSLSEAIAMVAKAELRLIDKIAPAPRKGADPKRWAEVDACATAVSCLIEGHLSEASRLREVLSGLKTLAQDLNHLSVVERTWYISVLDVNMRISELKKKKAMGQIFAQAFNEARDEKQFYTTILEKAPIIDLSYETISSCYHAIAGLKESFKRLENSDPKRAQIAKALKALRPLGKIITG